VAANRKGSGTSVNITTASDTIASGVLCAQEGFVGIAQTDAVSGGHFELWITGRWNIPVPSSTAKGDLLYAPATGGLVDEDNDLGPNLTRTRGTGVAPVVKAMEARRADGTADCLILPQAAQISHQQA
jgi:hypothetical protein